MKKKITIITLLISGYIFLISFIIGFLITHDMEWNIQEGAIKKEEIIE